MNPSDMPERIVADIGGGWGPMVLKRVPHRDARKVWEWRSVPPFFGLGLPIETKDIRAWAPVPDLKEADNE